MDTGVADTLVHLGQTGGIIVALWTEACEAIDAINACASVVTGVDGTVINVDVTHSACKTMKEDFRSVENTIFYVMHLIGPIQKANVSVQFIILKKNYNLLAEVLQPQHLLSRSYASFTVPGLVALGGPFLFLSTD